MLPLIILLVLLFTASDFFSDEPSTHSTYNQRQRICTLGKVRQSQLVNLNLNSFNVLKSALSHNVTVGPLVCGFSETL